MSSAPSKKDFIGKPCPYCGNTMRKRGPHKVSRDHVVPLSRGGKLIGPNRLIVCFSCNGHKSNNTLHEWQQRLEEKNDPRSKRVWWLIANSVLGQVSTT